MNKPRLHSRRQRALGDKLREGHPSQQCHQLAAVADAEREGVGAVAECAELGHQRLVEANGTRPALSGQNRVRVRERGKGVRKRVVMYYHVLCVGRACVLCCV